MGTALSSKVRRKPWDSTARGPLAARAAYLCRSPRPSLVMQRLRDFYRRYRQYILTDGLMYLVFIVALGLMFVFFG